MRRVLAALLLAGLTGAEASAAVQLTIRDGQVWLAADHATVAQILSEWTRVGRTQIVNGDRVPGGPLSIVLAGVPEQEALSVVLRAAGGYVTVNRPDRADDARGSESRFARIVVVPTPAGADPAVTRTAGSPAAPLPVMSAPPPRAVPIVTAFGAQRVIGPDGQPVPDDQEDDQLPPGVSPRSQSPAAAPPPAGIPTPPVGVARPGTLTPPASPKKPVKEF